jgi:hypothetical protein
VPLVQDARGDDQLGGGLDDGPLCVLGDDPPRHHRRHLQLARSGVVELLENLRAEHTEVGRPQMSQDANGDVAPGRFTSILGVHQDVRVDESEAVDHAHRSARSA